VGCFLLGITGVQECRDAQDAKRDIPVTLSPSLVTTAFYEAAFVNPLLQIQYQLPFQLISSLSLALFTLCPRVIGPTYAEHRWAKGE
jgi:hypothetical protein